MAVKKITITRRNVDGLMRAITLLNEVQEGFSKQGKAFLSLETLEASDKLMRRLSSLKQDEFSRATAIMKEMPQLDPETKEITNGEDLNAAYEAILLEEVELGITKFPLIVTEPTLIPISTLSTLREVLGEKNVPLESSRV